jgi:hypothetical protein
MDIQIRELERKAQASGDPQDQKLLDEAKQRAGLIPSLEHLAAKRQEYYDYLSAHGETIINNAIEKFLRDHKDVVKGLTWTQYTPYFMDGDPCYFSVNTIDYFLTDTYSAVSLSSWQVGKTKFEDDSIFTDARNAYNDLAKTLKGMEDVLEHVYGDHAEITAELDDENNFTLKNEECEHE